MREQSSSAQLSQVDERVLSLFCEVRAPDPTLPSMRVWSRANARIVYMLTHESKSTSQTRCSLRSAGQAGCLSAAALRRRPLRSASSHPRVQGKLTQRPQRRICNKLSILHVVMRLPSPPSFPPSFPPTVCRFSTKPKGACTRHEARSAPRPCDFGRAPGRRVSHDEEAVLPASKQFIFPTAGLHVAPTVRSLSCPCSVDAWSATFTLTHAHACVTLARQLIPRLTLTLTPTLTQAPKLRACCCRPSGPIRDVMTRERCVTD